MTTTTTTPPPPSPRKETETKDESPNKTQNQNLHQQLNPPPLSTTTTATATATATATTTTATATTTTTTTTTTTSSSSSETSRSFIKKFLPKPSEIIYKICAKAPLLIGWDDDKFRKLIEEQREKEKKQRILERQKRQQEDGITTNNHEDDDEDDDDDRLDIEKYGFGLQGILSNAVKEFVYEKSNFDDLKSDLKKIDEHDLQQNSMDGSTRSTDKKEHGIESGSNASSFNVREMKLYQNLLNSVKYQRDSYIMGVDHANKQKEKREQREIMIKNKQQQQENSESLSTLTTEKESKHDDSSSLAFPFGNPSSNTGTEMNEILLPYTTYQQYLNETPILSQSANVNNAPASLIHLTNIATWFIPSPTMHNTLLPTVLWTIAPPHTPPYNLPDGGPLRKQIVQSTSALIPLSQSLLDWSMKYNIMWYMKDKEWRDSMKGTTRSLVGGGENGNGELGQQGGSGKFVSTKTVSWD